MYYLVFLSVLVVCVCVPAQYIAEKCSTEGTNNIRRGNKVE